MFKHLGKILLVLALLPAGVAMATNDVTLTTDVSVISVGGNTLTINQTGTVDSLTVDTSSFTVTLAPGASIKVTSTDRKILNVVDSTNVASVTETCSSSANTNLISVASTASTAVVVTVTPLSPTCTVPTTTTTTSGGGGGGYSGSYVSSYFNNTTSNTTVAPTVTVKPATTVVSTQTKVNPTVSSAVSVPVSTGLYKELNVGKRSEDVKTLQAYLNSDPDTRVALAGAGSLGNETTLFGPATKVAVQKFQVKYGLAKKGDAGYGNVGPKTRAKLNALFANKAVSVPSAVVTPVASPVSSPVTVDTLKLQLQLLMKQMELLKAQRGL